MQVLESIEGGLQNLVEVFGFTQCPSLQAYQMGSFGRGGVIRVLRSSALEFTNAEGVSMDSIPILTGRLARCLHSA